MALCSISRKLHKIASKAEARSTESLDTLPSSSSCLACVFSLALLEAFALSQRPLDQLERQLRLQAQLNLLLPR